MNSEFSRKAWYLPLGVVLGWFALSLLLKPLYAPLEDRLVDARFRLRGEQAIDSSIVVLYLDNDQVASLGGWPIRRSYYALMVDVLHRLGASIVATDIFFQSRVPEYPEYDDLLVGVARDAHNVVLSGYFKSVERKDGRAFVLVPAAEAGKNEDIVLTQMDIRQLQLAKAAIYAGIVMLQLERRPPWVDLEEDERDEWFDVDADDDDEEAPSS